MSAGASVTLRDEPGARRWSAPRRRGWLAIAVGVIVAAVVIVVVSVDRSNERSASTTNGSGFSVTDHRDVGPFAMIELAGANTVMIHVGSARSVAVTGDDNLVDRVTTVVRGGRLVIDNTGSFTTNANMSVVVSVPSLAGVELGGAGTVTVEGVASDDFSAELTGGDEQMLRYLVRCNESWARYNPDQLVSIDSFEYALKQKDAEWWQSVCALIPDASDEEATAAPPSSDVPVLALNGEADPQDPPANMDIANAVWPNSLALVVPGQGHDIDPTSAACTIPLIQAFIDQGAVTDLDTACLSQVPPPTFDVELPTP